MRDDHEGRGGAREVVTVAPVAAPPVATQEEAKPVASARPAAPDGYPSDVLRVIRRLSATEHAIGRAGVDLLLENQASLMRSCRVVPEASNGAVVGIRLFGFTSDTILGRLGFENGDRVDAINGMAFATPEQALEVYATVRTADRLEVDVVRRGTPVRLVIHVE